MKYFFLLLLIIAMHTYACDSFENCCALECRNSSLQIGVDYTYADIKVHDHSFHGSLGGVQGSYEYRPWSGLYADIEASWKAGRVNHGHTHRSLEYVDVQERLGYTYSPCCQDWLVSFFSGFGFRFLGHKLEHSRDHSIRFDYNEFYIPVGIVSDYIFNFCDSRLAAGFNLIWMPQIYSTVRISPLKGARWVLKNTYGNVRVELPFSYSIMNNHCYWLIIKPFYEHWEDGRSTAKTFTGNSLGLPRNCYNFWGIDFNFAYNF